ncbi:serine--tRNA ligase [endosymbiont GvMRE of Glomus versiforme]|uniref:serine--tRNA ligase n=1 Tax=endosymbiont GvMRE of Glomus versiforme TaxID=2039283 RepID=UPI000ED3BA57|nr:serine--tRNA ligase [endosymbiont GvMRE of Glomus versiforme]RHZ37197.1 Serine--tRNA ligase [endosymbiont GvMRE of Glomus versiforme]
MLKRLFLNWEESISLLQLRGITIEQLLIIKNKWERKNQLIQAINQLNKEKNQLTKKGRETAQLVINLNAKIDIKEQELEKIKKELQELTEKIPNIPTPVDKTSDKEKADKKTEYFHDIKNNLTHEKILKKLKIINEEKSIKLSGSKFVVYQGLGSQLLHTLINFLLTENSRKGYQLFDTPYLVNAHNLYNTGQFHKFQDSLYKIEDSNFYLLPTAEVSLVNLYQDQILREEDLPLNLCAYSPCFRAERMASGEKNKGLVRLHQFHKVELVKIVKPEDSYQELEKLVSDVRNLLHLLKITHRVIEISVKELGFSAAKQYDIEVWLPVSKEWLEISSCSNCEDFQTERAKIRVKKANGQKYYPHSLNGSALAIDRLIATIMEYYYDSGENSLQLPECLRKFVYNEQ